MPISLAGLSHIPGGGQFSQNRQHILYTFHPAAAEKHIQVTCGEAAALAVLVKQALRHFLNPLHKGGGIACRARVPCTGIHGNARFQVIGCKLDGLLYGVAVYVRLCGIRTVQGAMKQPGKAHGRAKMFARKVAVFPVCAAQFFLKLAEIKQNPANKDKED